MFQNLHYAKTQFSVEQSSEEKEFLFHIFDLFLRLTTLCESAYTLKILKIIRRSSAGFFFVFSSDWFVSVSNLSYRRSGAKERKDSTYQVQRDRDISLYMHCGTCS